MARKWTTEEKSKHHNELFHLYVSENLSLGQIAQKLGLSEQGVYARLLRLKIPINRHLKKGYNNTSRRVEIPDMYSAKVAEFFGIMFGDGHISPTQVIVTLGTKELEYVKYVCNLIRDIFKTTPKVFIRRSNYRDSQYRNVYFGSVLAVKWLEKRGLVSNKVEEQVAAPKWIFSQKRFTEAFLRGFFDTDGSVYRLRFGIQISFTNYSLPLLKSLQEMLKELGYRPSEISSHKIYLTRVSEVKRFFDEISPKNSKHQKRFKEFIKCVGTQVVNGGRL
ncbi:MAG: LAGLIDADG family homing endonuclease [Candidatus Paceibacterota bacterium]